MQMPFDAPEAFAIATPVQPDATVSGVTSHQAATSLRATLAGGTFAPAA